MLLFGISLYEICLICFAKMCSVAGLNKTFCQMCYFGGLIAIFQLISINYASTQFLEINWVIVRHRKHVYWIGW